MLIRRYRFKFYLNARHRVIIDNNQSRIHPHTWEFVFHIKHGCNNFIQFDIIEKEIEEYLDMFKGKYLNDIEPFDRIEPLMENIGEVIYRQIIGILQDKGWELEKLEISENPTRTYIIVNEEDECQVSVGDGDFYIRNLDGDGNVEKILEGVTNFGRESQDSQVSRGDVLSEPLVEAVDLCELNSEDCVSDETEVLKDEIKHEQNSDGSEKTAYKLKGLVGKLFNIATGMYTDIHKKVSKMSLAGYLTAAIFIVITVAAALFFWLTKTGSYPWGSDSWYHLFKGHMLYNEILKGDFFPLYNSVWYNGVEPLRYWAPLPHYLLALFELITQGNTSMAYNLFISFLFVIGALGWIFWGEKTGRRRLGIILAVLWFFLPDNLRVMFSEGNISRVTVSAVLPYLFLGVWEYLETKNKKAFFAVPVCMMLITLCHAMISAMVGITICVFALLYGIVNKRIKGSVVITAAAFFGVLAAGIWLYPALTGGILSMDKESVGELMKGFTYNWYESLNPFLRLSNPDVFYFSISVILIAVAGILWGSKKSKAGFGVAVLIFLGTTKTFLPIVEKIPLSQLLWMMRFTPLAMGAFLTGLFLWKNIRKPVLLMCLGLLIVDSLLSFSVLGHNSEMPDDLQKSLDQAVDITTQRTALLDLSEFGSFPSYYLAFNEKKSVNQVFGSGWQGAKTSQNVMWMNTALEKQWYTFLFDRCLEMGADSVIVKKDKIKDMGVFLEKAYDVGYQKVNEDKLCIILKYPVNKSFGTKVQYEGIGIGKYADNISFLFPKFEHGNSEYIDDYSEEELLKYDVIYLSGFKYHNKEKAEKLTESLGQKGKKVIIDLTDADVDILSSRPSFLGVMAQPVTFKSAYPSLIIEGKEYIVKSSLPKGYETWNTIYLENLDNVIGSSELDKQELNFIGTKLNSNISFIGFNIPYFAVETGDTEAIGILEKMTGMKAMEKPQRELVEINVETNGTSLEINSAEGNVVTGVANLDSFITSKGSYRVLHNMIQIDEDTLIIKMKYPYFTKSVSISVTGILLILLLFMFEYSQIPFGLNFRKKTGEMCEA